MKCLLADVGGTHTRCAWLENDLLQHVEVFHNRQFASLEAVLGDYLQQHQLRPTFVLLGVAGRVHDQRVKLLNIDWRFSDRSICDFTGAAQTLLVNDFESLAYALPFLRGDEMQQCGGNTDAKNQTKAVLGPGTGLGVSGLVRSTNLNWIALSGEGGHVTLAATCEQEDALCRYLRERFGRASAERALSGEGLSNIYHFLTGADLMPQQISEQALQNEQHAVDTFALFFALLGSVAGDLALTLGATGGVYIGGGILKKNRALLNEQSFRQRFEDKGRFTAYLNTIPVYFISSETPAFAGLRYLATRMQASA